MDFKLLENSTFIKEDEEIRQVIDNMVKEVKADKDVMSFIKKIGVNDEQTIRDNVTTIKRFKEDLDYCRKCPGFNYCNKENEHYVNVVTYDGRFVNTELRPCKLKVQDKEKDKAFLIRDFPPSWRMSTIASLDKSKARMNLIKKYKQALNSTRNWIYITGSHRSGKSYIAATLLNAFIENSNNKAAFINYPTRVRDLQDLSYSSKEEFVQMINMYSSVELLVIDNFGNEYKNEFIRDSITLAILNERAHRGLITIFTSEFNYDDISNMYMINSSGKSRAKQLTNLLNDFASDPIDITTAAIY